MDEPHDTEFDDGDGAETREPDEDGAHADENAWAEPVETDEASDAAEPADAKKPSPHKASGSSKTSELDALLDSLNGSAERFQTLWFSFLGLTLYLAIAALATTHRNLLLKEPQTLPLVNIKVELLPFYIIAPLLYLVFHFYVLMMLVLLARTAAVFEDQLRKTITDDGNRERYRARVENALFLQLLVGMRGERSGFNAILLALIAVITIVLAPFATLILMQMMFLPYHSFGVTWWQRALALVDLGVVLVIWRGFFYHSRIQNPLLVLRARPRLRSGLSLAINLGAVAAVVWLSLWEGRWAGEPWIGRESFASTANGVVFGLFPDRLNLPSETLVGKEKLEKTKEEMISRNGDFVPTIKLDGRDLQAAKLSGADLRGVSLKGAMLRGAGLERARLDDASLRDAQLQAAMLSGAQLQGANLGGAQLQGADLSSAQLQGANLAFAQLQGADLSEAQLQGAILSGAQLQGADLAVAQLQGAYLAFAQLQGADLSEAQLQGADLSNAQLQGAYLSAAQLQGADLTGADLSDAELGRTFVYRVNFVDSRLATAAISSIEADKVKVREDTGETEPLTDADVDKWIAAAMQFARAEDKAEITQRFARLKPDFNEEVDQPKWNGIEEASRTLDPNGRHYSHRLASWLSDLVCAPEDAPYVALGFVSDQGLPYLARLGSLGDQFTSVRNRMEEGRKNPEKCPGVVGFTEDDWRQLEAIKPD